MLAVTLALRRGRACTQATARAAMSAVPACCAAAAGLAGTAVGRNPRGPQDHGATTLLLERAYVAEDAGPDVVLIPIASPPVSIAIDGMSYWSPLW